MVACCTMDEGRDLSPAINVVRGTLVVSIEKGRKFAIPLRGVKGMMVQSLCTCKEETVSARVWQSAIFSERLIHIHELLVTG